MPNLPLTTDRRIAVCAAALAATAPEAPSYGMTGGVQVFARLVSPEHFLHLRAGSLAAARKCQLGGFHAATRMHLAKAALLRRAGRREG